MHVTATPRHERPDNLLPENGWDRTDHVPNHGTGVPGTGEPGTGTWALGTGTGDEPGTGDPSSGRVRGQRTRESSMEMGGGRRSRRSRRRRSKGDDKMGHFDVVVVGGGIEGLAVLARLPVRNIFIYI